MDLFGMIFLVIWITLLIVALNLGGDAYAWNSPVIIGLLAGTGASFIAFLVAENKASHPVVPMGLFASWKYRNVPIITGRYYPNPIRITTDDFRSGADIAFLPPICFGKITTADSSLRLLNRVSPDVLRS